MTVLLWTSFNIKYMTTVREKTFTVFFGYFQDSLSCQSPWRWNGLPSDNNLSLGSSDRSWQCSLIGNSDSDEHHLSQLCHSSEFVTCRRLLTYLLDLRAIILLLTKMSARWNRHCVRFLLQLFQQRLPQRFLQRLHRVGLRCCCRLNRKNAIWLSCGNGNDECLQNVFRLFNAWLRRPKSALLCYEISLLVSPVDWTRISAYKEIITSIFV